MNRGTVGWNSGSGINTRFGLVNGQLIARFFTFVVHKRRHCAWGLGLFSGPFGLLFVGRDFD
jgi:hypothetical protein